VAIPLTSVDAVKSDISSKILLASLAVLALVIVLAFVLSRRLARPIREMASTAERIRQGDLDQRITVRSGDELGRLAESLNGMVDTLNADITKLRKLEQVRSEFLGNVSHELRTPIFAIQGMLETLLGGALEDREVNRSFVESALRNTERLNTLLADLIDISSIESGEMKMSFRYFAVRSFLESVVAEMTPAAARMASTVELGDIPADLEVLGDKERLRQVMVNLIDNAIKYSDRGRTVRVDARASDGRVTIAVTDAGVGIPAGDVGRIFERFYRVDKERSRDAGGTGLGLAIVKHIIEAHGSRVEVTSAVGSGSTFSFSLTSA
jgi:two-component system phosphate regulon sensor histidine kinase PhoR